MSIIKDPSTGRGAGVNADSHLQVDSVSIEQAQWASEVKGAAYSVIGTSDTLTATKVPVLYIKNTSTTKNLVIEQAIMQTIAEAATIPAVGIFWTIDLGAVVTSGSAVTPVNLNTGSGNTADVTALHSTPTISTGGSEIRKLYAQTDGDLVRVDAQGGIILSPNGTYLISYTTTGSAGIAVANVLFHMIDR